MAGQLLLMEHITKVYGNGVLANNDVTLKVAPGEIHALVGENGAGKSTLMKILYGVEQPDKGNIYLDGKKLSLSSTSEAIAAGIGMVYQHFKLIGEMTVAENIVLGKEPKKGLLFDRERARQITIELAEKYNFPIDPDTPVEELSVSQKQMVEILKVLNRKARLIILDEPTAVLTPQETERFFGQLRLLKAAGHTIIFISHKINEILEICDRITVMRRAKYIDTFETKNVTAEEISNAIIGYEMTAMPERSPVGRGESILKVTNLCAADDHGKQVLDSVSFHVHAGEVVGLVGIEGNGQTQLVEVLTGLRPASSGEVVLCGEEVTGFDLRALRQRGLSYIPEDRMVYGMAPGLSIEENIIADKFRQEEYSNHLFIKKKAMRKQTLRLIEQFSILCRSPEQEMSMLSGGNMQKVIAAREFCAEPHLMLAEQPTRGIDVGAARIIHEKCIEMRSQNKAVLLVSADMSEVLAVSDTILVIHKGELAACFDEVKGLTEQELGLYMLGVKRQSDEEIRRACHE